VYLKSLDKFQESFPHTKTKKDVHINIRPQTVFVGSTLHVRPTSVLEIFIYGGGGTLKENLSFLASISNILDVHQYNFMPVKPFIKAPGPLKV